MIMHHWPWWQRGECVPIRKKDVTHILYAQTHTFTWTHTVIETLWEVISLPVPAMPGQPSGAATSLCPSVPRFCARERESEGQLCLHQDTHDTQAHTWLYGALCPAVQTKRFYRDCSIGFRVCYFLYAHVCRIYVCVFVLFNVVEENAKD